MNITLPKSLVDFVQSLPWDDRGIISEIPAGGCLTYGNTHTDLGDPYGPPQAVHNPHPDVDGTNKVMLYSHPIPSDWVIPFPPPVGIAVWQVKGPDFRIVRTSRISLVGGTVFKVVSLAPDGPHPGVPVGGDSGSLTFVRVNGQWRVLGIVNFMGTASLPFWAESISTTTGSTIESNIPAEQPPTAWALNWINNNNEPTITMSSTHSITITNVTHSIRTVVLTGLRGDRWEHPINPAGYWPVIIRQEGGTATLSWDVSQTQGANYTISVVFGDGSSLTRTGVSSGDVLEWRPPTPPVVPTPQPDSVADLQAQISQLEQELAMQHDKVRQVMEELERLNRIEDSLESLGKAMGWSR